MFKLKKSERTLRFKNILEVYLHDKKMCDEDEITITTKLTNRNVKYVVFCSTFRN